MMSNILFNCGEIPPRERLSWEDSHMLEAMLIAKCRSPDPNTQVGAHIVNHKNRTISKGYNGFPNGIDACSLPWDRESKSPLGTKYMYVVHAEENATYNATTSLEKSILYVTLYPCHNCTKAIIQSGISKVVYLTNPYKDTDSCKASQRMFELLDIKVVQHKWSNPQLVRQCLQDILNLIPLEK